MPNPGPPQRPLPLQASDLLLILIIGLAAVRLFGMLMGGLVGGLRPPEGSDPDSLVGMLLLLLGFQTAALVGAVYLVAHRWCGVAWQELGLRPAPSQWYSRATAAALLAFPLTIGVNLLVQKLRGGIPFNPQFDVVAPAGFSWFALIGMLVMVGVLMPFAEELLFRGIFYRWLRERWGVPAAVVVSSLGFSALHGIVWLIPAVALLGVILALIYEWSGSLWPSVLAHGLYNAVAVVLLYAALAQGVPLAQP